MIFSQQGVTGTLSRDNGRGTRPSPESEDAVLITKIIRSDGCGSCALSLEIKISVGGRG